jgi:hypothetical protein
MESAGELGMFFIVVYILLRIAKAEEESRRLERGGRYAPCLPMT